ncbi:uncharacterized SAM-binding protein YcdF (DUF218 family) [Litorivivens lipolytica]|uniref:Uncharacterized SAM-binding protein YcdF (DUF218 family) n=1 Tax=Litorivivens lipolytica TaxID=1524264 RepID=A0A7W4W530_9GAMM|nr:DUF802 domain-containing protein [Litorivivens lipolytica]MBB3047603.1 uncharacterized SAM-binding protein YcdF (DUF218 family) [Litorivivens lipolytica]
MTRTVSIILFALGALVVLWMSSSFVASSVLALLVSLLIAAAYTTGFVELLRYQSETGKLQQALNTAEHPVADLNQWLAQLPASLRFSVRQRINGEATGLPAPLLTPYLVGLLVMLGLLGTFLGMVETLQGAVGALQGSTELEAIRQGLAAPIEGLGLAFATSVAGVTASAMLGLISTLSRRERLLASRQLDAEMGDAFKTHSLSYQRRQTYDVLQAQATALPAAAAQLGQLAEQFDARFQQLADSLGASHKALQDDLATQQRELNRNVSDALSAGFRDTGKVAAESAQPILQSFIQKLGEQSQATQEQISAAVSAQLSGISRELEKSTLAQQAHWQEVLQQHQQGSNELMAQIKAQLEQAQSQFTQGSEALLQNLQKSNTEWLESSRQAEQERAQQSREAAEISARQLAEASNELAEKARENATAHQEKINQLLAQSSAVLDAQQQRDEQWQQQAAQNLQTLIDSATEQLSKLRNDEQQRSEATAAQLKALQDSSAEQLAKLGAALEAPMTRLIETASEAPRAAAEVIEQMRAEISKNIERDNGLLEERRDTLGKLESLSASLEENARLQREAVQAMLEGSSESLGGIAEKFEQKVAGESEALSEQIAHFSASTAELTALGEVFTNAVQQFGEANTQLMARLEKMEAVLASSGQRSDEQMEYYLSQAREIIDHNLLTHQELLAKLQAETATNGND